MSAYHETDTVLINFHALALDLISNSMGRYQYYFLLQMRGLMSLFKLSNIAQFIQKGQGLNPKYQPVKLTSLLSETLRVRYTLEFRISFELWKYKTTYILVFYNIPSIVCGNGYDQFNNNFVVKHISFNSKWDNK